MLLKGYRKEIFRPECDPNFQSVHCIAHLDRDVRDVLPYLNAVLGGTTYIQDPPSVTFKARGRLISVYSQRIAINALKDENYGDQILEWLRQEINETWEKREGINPSFQGTVSNFLFVIGNYKINGFLLSGSTPLFLYSPGIRT